jgi:hypothetical protein
LHAVGPEVLAWLGWLVRLPCSIATKAAAFDPAWVQAIGSIVAIAAGFVTVYIQNRLANGVRERERKRRAEVVAYRVSAWLDEVGARVERALTICRGYMDRPPSGGDALGPLIRFSAGDLRVGTVTNIEGVLPDLHYLLAGSGDIAQLTHVIRMFEAWLSSLTEGRKRGTTNEQQELYEYSESQLMKMRILHANAERHISPLVQKAIDGGR